MYHISLLHTFASRELKNIWKPNTKNQPERNF